MKFLKRPPLRFWIIGGIILVISCLSYGRAFDNYELISYDFRLNLRPRLSTSPDIFLIEISDDTLKNLGKWPLPRDFHASLVRVLKEYGARLIVFDVLFSEPTLYDEMFAKSIEEAGNVYLPVALYLPEIKQRGNQPIKTEVMLADLSSSLDAAARGEGQINVFIDADGKIRRSPLFISYKDRLFANLGLQAACAWQGLDNRKVEFRAGKVIIEGKLILPVSNGTSFLVNYPDKWRNSFRHFSYFEILKSYSDIQKGLAPKIDLSVFKDKACFVGLTATGTSDLRANPLENVYPMLGLQASVFNSIIQQKFIRDAGRLANSAVNIFIFLLSALICISLRPLRSFLLNLTLALAYFLSSIVLFISLGLWLDLFFPLLIIFLAYAGSLLYRFLDELKKREVLEKELDIARTIQKSFLPPDIKEFCDFKISAFMQPAKFVAGDLYDIAPLDEKRLAVLIGDVSGKGVPASLIMAQTISLFRVFSRQYMKCSEVLERINRELYGRFQGRFVTLLYMVINTENNKVCVSSAGQAPLLRYSKLANKVSEIELAMDLPLGVMEGLQYQESSFDLEPGDRIVLFTDGVSEARDRRGQEFGLNQVKKIISEKSTLAPEQICLFFKESLAKFAQSCPQHDDITLIILGKS